MSNPLLDALGTAGYVLDTPGAYLRGALAGAPGERRGGREMLESWGAVGPRQDDGLDWGDAIGFGAEMLLDPISLAGPLYGAYKGTGALGRASGLLSHADDGTAMARRLGELGGQPLDRRLAELAGGEHSIGMLPESLGPTAQGLPDLRSLEPMDYRFGTKVKRDGDVRAMVRGSGNERLGEVVLSPNSRFPTDSVNYQFPDLPAGLVGESDKIGRVPGSHLAKSARGQGIGQQLYIDALDAAGKIDNPVDWFYNSGNSADASRVIEALAGKGLIENHWAHRRGVPQVGGPRLMRLTDAGRELAGTGKLVHGPLDPLPALRDEYRNTVGKSSPIGDAIGNFLGDESGALRPFEEIGRRSDPDIVNARDWFHGGRTPGLSAVDLDPMKTTPKSQLGRGIYLAGDPAYAEGFRFADTPLYEAKTNLGRIGDVNLPADADVVGRLRDSLAGLGDRVLEKGSAAGRDLSGVVNTPADLRSLDRRFRHDGTVPLMDYLDPYLRGREVLLGRLPAAGQHQMLREGDDLIRLLRESGLDALIQTEGQGVQWRAAQRGANPDDPLMQVLALLDPNDTLSRVGRAGQVTRFQPRT